MRKWHPLSGEGRETAVNICSWASKPPVRARPEAALWQGEFQGEDIPKGGLTGENP